MPKLRSIESLPEMNEESNFLESEYELKRIKGSKKNEEKRNVSQIQKSISHKSIQEHKMILQEITQSRSQIREILLSKKNTHQMYIIRRKEWEKKKFESFYNSFKKYKGIELKIYKYSYKNMKAIKEIEKEISRSNLISLKNSQNNSLISAYVQSRNPKERNSRSTRRISNENQDGIKKMSSISSLDTSKIEYKNSKNVIEEEPIQPRKAKSKININLQILSEVQKLNKRRIQYQKVIIIRNSKFLN